MDSDFWWDLASVFRAGRNKARASDLILALDAMAEKCGDIAARKAVAEGKL